jgi:hypothetical protein
MDCGLDVVADIPFPLATSECKYTALGECGAVANGDWDIDEFGHTLD